MTYLSQTDMDRAEQIFAAIPVGREEAIMEIVEEVADATGVPSLVLLGDCKRRYIAHARQLVYFVAHSHGFSLLEIGRVMRRDHTTILSGIRAERIRRESA